MNKIIGMILSAVFGLFFMAAGVAGVAMEYKTPPLHTTHLFVFAFLVLLGGSLLPWIGQLILDRVKDGVGIARDAWPVFGRRASQGEVALAAPAATPHVDRGEGDETGEAT